MSIPKMVAWKAVDGKVFTIDTQKENINNQDQLYAHIAKLRKQHGYDEPTFMSLQGFTKDGEKFARNAANTTLDDISPEHRDQVEQMIKEAYQRPDPKKLN